MQGKTIAGIVSFILFLALAGGTLYVSLAYLKPSIDLSNGIVTTSCQVTGTEDQTTCNNVKCVDQNTDIWWYNSWGPSYFFVYVSGGTGNSDYYDDDGGDDDDDDGGDDDDDDDDDGGDSGDGDSGGDSGGGDSGGDSGGGDIGGGDEMKMSKSKLLKAGLLGGSSFGTTTGGSEFNGYIPQEIKDKRLERRLKEKQQKQLSRSLKAATTNAAPTSGSSYYASSASGCNTCYQGVFYVNYTIGNGTVVQSSIQGLVSSDYTWVSDYIGNYQNGSFYTCYYQSGEPTNVVWFKPPKYNSGSLAGTIILSILSFISLIASALFFIFAYKHNSHHHHHHHNQNTTKKHHASGAYKPIVNPTPISAKKGNYQSYHKNNGSYHGGYSASDSAPPQNVPYYQYNQGVAQIDFSANHNNYGSINYVNAPPSYGN